MTSLVCGGRCFAACEDSVGYSNALARCNQWGGTLASISSAADQPCVDQLLATVPADLWIGYVQTTPALAVDLGWSWLDGTPSTAYTNWSVSQPDDADGVEDGDEQCGEIFVVDHKRNDLICASANPVGMACSK
ncbi:MAG: macrophage mannose receptor 1 [Myxococcales bacterium]|nr:macrophage mannose receptor 1 [Myxococcales bacterium]